MSLDDLLRAKRLITHEPSVREIRDLIDKAERDLRHAETVHDSEDWRFIVVYNAGLSLATIPLAALGFRASGPGHHVTVITALPASLGEDAHELMLHLNEARALRNRALYDQPHIVTADRVDELLDSVEELRRLVLAWLAEEHPELLPGHASEE